MSSSGMCRLVILVGTDVSDELMFVDCFDPEDGGDNFLLNVGSYKNHTETHPRR
jgi:hypothetical protein